MLRFGASGPRFRLEGITDEVDVCELCGKKDLKCTMLLVELDADGNELGEVYYGRDCGAAALGWNVSADRAEKLVKGTARVDWWAADKAWRAWNEACYQAGHGPTGPAPFVVDGVDLEVWDRFTLGRVPADAGWVQVAKDSRQYWRVKKGAT